MVLVGIGGQDWTHLAEEYRRLVRNGWIPAAAARQSGGRPGQRRELPVHPEQLLQRRHQVARRGLPPHQAIRVRGLRRAAELRPLPESQCPLVILTSLSLREMIKIYIFM